MKKNTRFFCGNKRFMSFGNQLVMFYRPYSCINRSHFCLVKKKRTFHLLHKTSILDLHTGNLCLVFVNSAIYGKNSFLFSLIFIIESTLSINNKQTPNILRYSIQIFWLQSGSGG